MQGAKARAWPQLYLYRGFLYGVGLILVSALLWGCPSQPPGSCKDDADCTTAGRVCRSGLCQAPAPCSQDDDCKDKAKPHCDKSKKECVGQKPGCKEKADCKGSPDGQFCDAKTGKCVLCAQDADCGRGKVCVESRCEREGFCKDDAHCTGALKRCDVQAQECRECASDAHCKAPTPKCSALGTCVGCQSKADCSGAAAHCLVKEQRCVACLQKSHCKPGEACVDNACAPLSTCEEDRDCTDSSRPHCNTTSKRCSICVDNSHCNKGFECNDGRCDRKQKCSADEDCIDPGFSRCDSGSQKCVACLSHAHCTGALKFCSKERKCVACAGDKDCTDSKLPYCISDGTCAACVADANCTSSQTCVGNRCIRKVKCKLDSDCGDPTFKVCEKSAERCVECVDDSHCKAGFECKRNACAAKTECSDDKDCITAGLTRCNTRTKKCVKCLSRLGCKAGEDCRNNACVPWCFTDSSCTTSSKPACDVHTGACVACTLDQHCAKDQRCDGASGACKAAAACTKDADCPSSQDFCDGGKCVQCTKDSNCPLTPSGQSYQSCDVTKKHCVECTKASDCPLNHICEKSRCLRACKSKQDCDAQFQCLKSSPSASLGVCGKCLKDADCNSGEKCNLESFICGSCGSHADCAGNKSAPYCDPTSARCTDGCSEHSHCTHNSAGTVCDTRKSRCVQCTKANDCPRGKRCDVLAQKCVDCIDDDSHCNNNQICAARSCEAGCSADSECGSGLKCSGGRCRECDASRPCKAGKKCSSIGTCVDCAKDADCASGSYCDLAVYRCFPKKGRSDCHPCQRDFDCAPGYRCITQDLGGTRVEKVCLKRCTKDLQCTGYSNQPAPPPNQAPPGCQLKLNGKKAYFFCNNGLNWSSAQSFCKRHGAHLVVLNDRNEANFIGSSISTNVWVGLTDPARSGAWAWAGASSSYIPWCPSQPRSGYDCAQLSRSWCCPNTTNCVYAERCNYNRPFVCEVDSQTGVRGYSCDTKAQVCRPRWGGGTGGSSCRAMWTRKQRCTRETSNSGVSLSCGLASRQQDQKAFESHCSTTHDNRCLMMCNNAFDCPPGFACDSAENQCVKKCQADKDCDGGEVCDTSTSLCVACAVDSHCPTGKICKKNTCSAAECSSDKDCSGGLACVGLRCRECKADSDCPGARKCSPIGRCLRCLKDADCGSTSRCDTRYGLCFPNANRGACMPCAKEADCETGYTCAISTNGAPTSEKACLQKCSRNEDCLGYDANSRISYGYFCDTKAGVCRPRWRGNACAAIWTQQKPCKRESGDRSSTCALFGNASYCSSQDSRCQITCSRDDECPLSWRCLNEGNLRLCVRSCKSDDDCGGLQRCNSSTGLCASCTSDSHCKDSSKPICDTGSGQCVPCVIDSHCKDAKFPVCTYDIKSRQGRCSPPLCKGGDCKGGATCTKGRCRECSSTKPCPNGLVCDAQGACVACTKDADCGAGNACDPQLRSCHPAKDRGQCMPCTRDSQCKSGYRCYSYQGYNAIRADRVCLKGCKSNVDCDKGYLCYSGLCRPRWGAGSRRGDAGTCASMWTRKRSCHSDLGRSPFSSACGIASQVSYCCSPTLYESECSNEQRCKMSCAAAGDCPTGFTCDATNNTCIKHCAANKDCASSEICNTTTKRCSECLKDADCKDPKLPVCDAAKGRCAACAKDSDCKDPKLPLCKANACTVSECPTGTCPNSAHVCEKHRCKECTATKKCPSGVCTPNGRCVACLKDADCKATETCDTSAQQCFPKTARQACMPCTKAADCAAGYACVQRDEFAKSKGRVETVCLKICTLLGQPCLDSQGKETGYWCGKHHRAAPNYVCLPGWSGGTNRDLFQAPGGSCAALWTRGRACSLDHRIYNTSTACGLGSTYRMCCSNQSTESYCSTRPGEGCLITCLGVNVNRSRQECPNGLKCNCNKGTPCRCEP